MSEIHYTVCSFHSHIISLLLIPTYTLTCENKIQKRQPEVFYKKGALKNFAKFTENTCAGVSFLIKLPVYLSVLRNF